MVLSASRTADESFVGLARRLGERFAPRVAEHDRDNSFVAENYAELKEAGYTALPIPELLGGLGASLRQVVCAQAELGRHCAATALAISMHLHPVATNVWRWHRGAPGAEEILRRIAADRLVVGSSGASDFTHPTGTAVAVEGGFRVTGRKAFCSQAPVIDLLSTAAVLENPGDGPEVVGMLAPARGDGFRVLDTWDTLGMRATASHDVELAGVFVPDSMVLGRRPLGKLDPSLRAAYIHGLPILSAPYWGIAAAARDEALHCAAARGQVEEPGVQRLTGTMNLFLRRSWWALMGALDELPQGFEPTPERLVAVAAAKHEVTTAAIEVVDTAMEVVGGVSFYRRSPLERAYRDVRAGKYHPFTPEVALRYAGRVSLGLPGDVV